MSAILLAEDDPDIRHLVAYKLGRCGFRIEAVADGLAALRAVRLAVPDLAILDVQMPKLSGIDVCREMRAGRDTAHVPILILTARTRPQDLDRAFAAGATDYVVKPFSPRELAARVRAVLRRVEREPEGSLLRAGDITLDEEAHRVWVGDQPVDLTRTEFELLAVMMRSPGRVFSRGELLDRLQGGAIEGYERTIDVHIRNLRAKIEADSRQPRYVETVYGVGYRFAQD